MYIKEDLVYDKHTGELTGYCDLGEINNHLINLQQQYMAEKEDTNQLATTVMVLMVRGLFTTLEFPYAIFPSANLTGEQLVPIFYEAMMRLEMCGFKVLCITLDSHSVNRKLFKLVANNSSNKIKYKFKNPLSYNAREVFLFSDPPHLIKIARNCLSNPKRNMEVL